jgi:RNA polymerase sigma factor (sigma-70 family)
VAVAVWYPPAQAEEDEASAHTDALYREHHRLVATICRLLLRDRDEAEDATQQVFLSAHRALLNGVAPREPAAWLATIARHECRSRRKLPALVVIDENSELEDSFATDPPTSAMQRADLEALWEEIARLPQAQRDALLLREICGLSYSQLAAELEVTRASARSLLSRAREHVRRTLRDTSAGLSNAPWLAQLARLIEGGPSPAAPVPTAGKLVAVAVGAVALVAGGASDAHFRQVAAKPPVEQSVAAEQAPIVHPAAQRLRRVEARPTPVTAVRAAPVVDDRHRDGGGESRRDGGAAWAAVVPEGGGGTTVARATSSGPGPGDRTVTTTSDGGSGRSSDGGSGDLLLSHSGDSGTSGSGSSDGGSGSSDG